MKVKINYVIAASIIAMGVGVSMQRAYAAEESQAALSAEASVTEAQAKSTALKKVPHGVIKSAELERENGRLVWSFDVARSSVKGVTEIQIDAKTGKIVSMKKETPAQEAKELKNEEQDSKK